MHLLSPIQTATLRDWFLPERPGPLIGLHVLHTGNGACFVDRWPDPRAVLVDTAGNYALHGDPHALTPADLRAHVAGFVEAPDSFVPLLRETFTEMQIWKRVIFDLSTRPDASAPPGFTLRRLIGADAYHLWGLSSDVNWIGKTWGGPAGLAHSGMAWGAFAAGRLVAVACTFFVGDQYEEIGVATEAAWRGKGVSTACAAALCHDVFDRGRRPSWTTSPDNIASARVAEKLGFTLNRRDRLYVIGVSIPDTP